MQLRGVDGAKFRKHVVPGDQLKLVVTLGATRGPLVKASAVAEVDGQTVVEAELLLAVQPIAHIDPPRRCRRPRSSAPAPSIGAFAVVGPHVRIGRNCKIGASSVIEGHTTIGDGNEIFPYASIGLAPQDLKYKGEPTRLEIGSGNIFREFVTIHRGTEGGGGVTTIGDRNLFMNYVHVAHDCHVGNQTIFGPHATLGGHVAIADFVNVSAGSAVHQFCRVGAYAFIGGYSVITKDALPYGRTVGSRPARVFGLNLIGLKRRGFADDTLKKLRAAYRYLTQSKLNTTQAIEPHRAGRVAQVPGSRQPRRIHPHRLTRRDPAPRREEDGRRPQKNDRWQIGLIAGNGRFPFLVLDAARAMGHEVVVIGIKEEASKEIEEAAARPPRADVHWVSIGQLGTFLKILEDNKITQAVMAGQVKHVKIFGGFMPDMTAMSLMGKLKGFNTDALIGAVADLMRERGVELVNSAKFLEPLLAGEGQLSDRAPNEAERKDLEFGYRMADTIAGLDIGQTIAVKHQAVVAVEAMEGTDETIARAGHLAGDGVSDHQGGQAQPGHAL